MAGNRQAYKYYKDNSASAVFRKGHLYYDLSPVFSPTAITEINGLRRELENLKGTLEENKQQFSFGIEQCETVAFILSLIDQDPNKRMLKSTFHKMRELSIVGYGQEKFFENRPFLLAYGSYYGYLNNNVSIKQVAPYFIPYKNLTLEQFLTLKNPLGKSFEHGAEQEIKLAILAAQIAKNDDAAKADIAWRLHDQEIECLALFKALIASYQKNNQVEFINITTKALLVAYKMVIGYESSQDEDDKTKKAKLAAVQYLLSKEVDLTSLESIKAARNNKEHKKMLSQGRLGKICKLIQETFPAPKKEMVKEESIRLGVDTLPSQSGFFSDNKPLARKIAKKEKEDMIEKMEMGNF